MKTRRTTPAESFFKAREAWLREDDPSYPASGELYDEYVLARAAWEGYDAWQYDVNRWRA